jgi:hypothetical protein
MILIFVYSNVKFITMDDASPRFHQAVTYLVNLPKPPSDAYGNGMIYIQIKGDDREFPELWQIWIDCSAYDKATEERWKKWLINPKYTLAHYEPNTHEEHLELINIDNIEFPPKAHEDNYEISVYYGDELSKCF